MNFVMSENNVNTMKSAQEDIGFVRRRLDERINSEDVRAVLGEDFVDGQKK